MKKLALSLLLFSAFAFGKGHPHVFHAKGKTATHSQRSRHKRITGNGIDYHGGPVVLNNPKLYFIWYGSWTSTSPEVSILTTFANNLGGTPYEDIDTSYYDGSNEHVSGLVTYGNAVFDNYSKGKTLADSDVETIVASHVGKDLPVDVNGVYFVLTSGDVAETSGFGSQYCGWHNDAQISGNTLLYAFVGDANPNFTTGCAAQAVGPNGTSGADGMASVIAHELEETISDPRLNAWYDSQGNENGDKCAWQFGTTYVTSNGAQANMKLGGLDFLIQENWLNASGGKCVLSSTVITAPQH